MFGIGLGEIIIILLVIFFISPKEIPKFLKKLGQFFAAFNKIKDELLQINNEVKDIISEEVHDITENSIDDKSEVYKNLKALGKKKKREHH
jgi:Sec-independent protein translocase protein TatA